jgi:hypothetical protein
MNNKRSLGRIVLRAAAMLATPVVIVVACSSTSNRAASEGGDAAVADGAEDGRDGSIGAIKELNAEAAVTNGVTCGSTTCTPPTGGMLPLGACCLTNNGCGASIGAALTGIDAGPGSCIDPAAGRADPSCPAQSIMGMSLASCCSAAGVCGVDLSVLNLGCNSLSVLGALAPATGAPQPCGDAAGGPVSDASAE